MSDKVPHPQNGSPLITAPCRPQELRRRDLQRIHRRSMRSQAERRMERVRQAQINLLQTGMDCVARRPQLPGRIQRRQDAHRGDTLRYLVVAVGGFLAGLLAGRCA